MVSEVRDSHRAFGTKVEFSCFSGERTRRGRDGFRRVLWLECNMRNTT